MDIYQCTTTHNHIHYSSSICFSVTCMQSLLFVTMCLLVGCAPQSVQVNEFRGVEYSAAVADFFTWDNLRPDATWHPKIKNIVYWGQLPTHALHTR